MDINGIIVFVIIHCSFDEVEVMRRDIRYLFHTKTMQRRISPGTDKTRFSLLISKGIEQHDFMIATEDG